jgi:PAS domain S-box-containing protein
VFLIAKDSKGLLSYDITYLKCHRVQGSILNHKLDRCMADAQTTQFQIPIAQASDTLHLAPPRLHWSAVLPIPVLIATIIGLWIADLPDTYHSPNLNLLLNFVFTTLISLLIALMVARGYLTRGQPALLLLGAGVLIWGASGTIAVVFGQNDPNTIITIHNLCVLLSASCHLCSSLLAVRPAEIKQKDTWLITAYAVSIALVAMVTIAARAGWTPQFFIQGQGGTILRQLVLVASIAMFTSSAAIISLQRYDSKSAFSGWYAMALLLIATGIFGITVQPAYSSLVGWAGRIAQYLGAFYMLIAAVAAIRESGSWQVSLEKQLNQARQDYYSLLDLAADGIFVCEPKGDESEGRLLQVNPALCQLLGYDATELLSMTPGDIEDQSSTVSLTKPGGKMHYESCLTSKDGRLIPVEISTRHFQRQNCLRRLSIIRDITERKRAEESLREIEQRFRLSLRGGDVTIAMCDRELRYTWIYDPHPDFDSTSTIGKRDTEIADNDGTRQLEALKRKAIDTGDRVRNEIAFPLTTGNQIYDIQAEPHFNGSGSVESVTTIAIDISAQKKVEEELRVAKGQLQLLNENLEQVVADRTELAESRAKQLQGLAVELMETEERERRQFSHLLHEDLQQLLASAKMQVQAAADKLSSEPMLIDVAKLLEVSIAKSRQLSHDLSPAILHNASLVGNLEWLAGQMKERFDLRVELESKTELLMEQTPQRVFLFRAVQELLFNVVKHAAVKSAKVEVTSSQNLIAVTVSDLGKGFDTSALETFTGKTGLGLMSLRERASYIGGSLTIESSPGKGSRFILRVPIMDGTVHPYSPVPQVEDTTHIPAGTVLGAAEQGIRVLFADDHKVMRQGLIRLVAGKPGILVVGEASNGKDALEKVRLIKPDVVVMDISMPEMDGIEATRHIKAELPDVRVIGLSMHEDEHIAQVMREAGAEVSLSKTISSSKLLKAIYGAANEVQEDTPQSRK